MWALINAQASKIGEKKHPTWESATVAARRKRLTRVIEFEKNQDELDQVLYDDYDDIRSKLKNYLGTTEFT